MKYRVHYLDSYGHERSIVLSADNKVDLAIKVQEDIPDMLDDDADNVIGYERITLDN